MSNEIYSILQNMELDDKKIISRKEIFKLITNKFSGEKDLNLRKRMYDVLNIYQPLNIIRKNKKKFEIVGTAPYKFLSGKNSKISKGVVRKYDKLVLEIKKAVS